MFQQAVFQQAAATSRRAVSGLPYARDLAQLLAAARLNQTLDPLAQGFELEGLGQHVDARLLSVEDPLQDLAVVAGHEEHRELWPDLAQTQEELPAVEARQDHVEQGEVEAALGPLPASSSHQLAGVWESEGMSDRPFAPAADRNKDELLAVLPRILPSEGLILELASGTGQHAAHFAPRFPQARWQPSDQRPEALAGIRAWTEGQPNVLAPLVLDVTTPEWPIAAADAIVTVNLLHIAPWEVCLGWLAGAARTLRPGAPLYYYGPLLRRDRPNAPSNLAFDEGLRQRDPSWGVRYLEDVRAEAERAGLSLDEVIEMPNNNLSLVFRPDRE